jgi:hypothetical protein
MDPKHKRVLSTPLSELWDRNGRTLDLRREGDLSAPQIQQLLRQEAVQFVVADPGLALLWLNEKDSLQFWKEEVRGRVHRSGTSLEDYPGEYCYQASLWRESEQAGPVVLLEKCH